MNVSLYRRGLGWFVTLSLVVVATARELWRWRHSVVVRSAVIVQTVEVSAHSVAQPLAAVARLAPMVAAARGVYAVQRQIEAHRSLLSHHICFARAYTIIKSS